jgi:NAD(P)-dependent dehydrogenase (short-subunit alcohol dehydrogenase family)
MLVAGSAAVVSGGASGLGEAVVRKLVAGGAHVVIADLTCERGEALTQELGDHALFVHCDVRSEADVPAVRPHKKR